MQNACSIVVPDPSAAASPRDGPLSKAALARRELHRLLEDQELASTPLLVLANKVDLEPHMSDDQVIRELNLDYITTNPWILIPISALKVHFFGVLELRGAAALFTWAGSSLVPGLYLLLHLRQ